MLEILKSKPIILFVVFFLSLSAIDGYRNNDSIYENSLVNEDELVINNIYLEDVDENYSAIIDWGNCYFLFFLLYYFIVEKVFYGTESY